MDLMMIQSPPEVRLGPSDPPFNLELLEDNFVLEPEIGRVRSGSINIKKRLKYIRKLQRRKCSAH